MLKIWIITMKGRWYTEIQSKLAETVDVKMIGSSEASYREID